MLKICGLESVQARATPVRLKYVYLAGSQGAVCSVRCLFTIQIATGMKGIIHYTYFQWTEDGQGFQIQYLTPDT